MSEKNFNKNVDIFYDSDIINGLFCFEFSSKWSTVDNWWRVFLESCRYMNLNSEFDLVAVAFLYFKYFKSIYSFRTTCKFSFFKSINIVFFQQSVRPSKIGMGRFSKLKNVLVIRIPNQFSNLPLMSIKGQNYNRFDLWE